MFIFTHSQDILHLTISFSVLIIACLLAWLLFYIISIIKDLRNILNRTKDTITAAQETVSSLKKKIDETSIQFKFILEGIKTLTDWLKEKKSDKSKSDSSHLAVDQKKSKNK